VFSGAGQATTKTNLWLTGRVAIIPGDGRIGTSAFAPVLRAMQVAGMASDAPIDTNGMTAYRFTNNNGKEFQVDVQVNSLGMPDEQRLAVINAGV
jgi:uncharacterized protein affecting Mg2+/Co2+ transport